MNARFGNILLMSVSLLACPEPGSSGRALPPAYRSLVVPEARLATPEAQARGRGLFVQHCALCHGIHADGRGVRVTFSTRPADFSQPDWPQKRPPREAFAIIREGLRGTSMGPWKNLTTDQTWDLVAYLRGVSQGAGQTSSDEVGQATAEPAARRALP